MALLHCVRREYLDPRFKDGVTRNHDLIIGLSADEALEVVRKRAQPFEHVQIVYSAEIPYS